MVKYTQEWQFDGLVGPTHHYAGLAFGNLASDKNAGSVSNPRLAALQGLEKMRLISGLGTPQAFFPPQKRPIISILQRLGFGRENGRFKIAETIDNVYKNAPHILSAAYSSSFMWAANAATVSPSSDTGDGKLHLTPANLVSHLHRSLEAEWTKQLLQRIFHNDSLFAIHNSLPSTASLADEGAANHMRVCNYYGDSGIEVFVYGAGRNDINKTSIFPARQQQEASASVARLHGLNVDKTVMVQQNPSVIDRGVFHHDVIGMNTTSLMVCHEAAFTHRERFISELKQAAGAGFRYIEVQDKDLSVEEAVQSYLFNSQLIDLGEKGKVLVAPAECQEFKNAHMTVRRLIEDDRAIATVHYIDVRESMRNGGGPACLRLRVVMTPEEAAAIHPGVVLTEARYIQLKAWVERYYRDRLCFDDLRDIALVDELEEAYAALEPIIGMPGLYTAGGGQ